MKEQTAMQEGQQWVIIEDSPNYSINPDGDIRNNGTGKIIKKVYSKGYLYCGLFSNGVRKFFFRHRLVAKAFIPNPENKPEVNHKNGKPDDNKVDNLEWATHAENVKHAYDTGLRSKTKEKAPPVWIKNKDYQRCKPVINTKTGEVFESGSAAAKHYGIDRGDLTRQLKGKLKNKFSLDYFTTTYKQPL